MKLASSVPTFYFSTSLPYSGASLVAQMVKNLPAMQKTWVRSLGQEDPWEKRIATHSNILAWRIPWTGEPGGYSPWGRKESDTTEWLTHSLAGGPSAPLCSALLAFLIAQSCPLRTAPGFMPVSPTSNILKLYVSPFLSRGIFSCYHSKANISWRW